MQQVVLNVSTGKITVEDVPDPIASPGEVVIANRASVISAGTEKMVHELASKNLLQKARARPDHVRRVLDSLRERGPKETYRLVRGTLGEPVCLGYSSAGVVIACGEGVEEFRPGDHVASNGHHAGVVRVPKHLCARADPDLPFAHAAFGVIGAIALQGVRLSRLRLGETAFVVGLGLVGQIVVALLRASGVRVIGTDLDEQKCHLAVKMGADYARPKLGADEVMRQSAGLGADAVLITAATKSNQPIELAGDAARMKGRVVVVGAIGMTVPRNAYYLKEVELVVSCSYGPGRYDPDYEDRGHDYPVGYVRWTEQRNISAVLELMARGSLDVTPLISHHFAIDSANDAYALIESASEPYLGIVLDYPGELEQDRNTIKLQGKVRSGTLRIGCLGAGGFARNVLLPQLLKVPDVEARTLCSAGGLSAVDKGKKLGFRIATSEEDAVFDDPEIDAVFVITRHNLHASQTLKAIAAKKHVFVEKPLALRLEEIDEIEHALLELGDAAPLIMVGFNRRFSPAAIAVRSAFADVEQPLTVSVRFNAGQIEPDHWTQDPEVGGGRLIGEACHAIDLATFLVGSPPVRVFAESIGGANAPAIRQDQSFLVLRHANGSVSSIGYLAGGSRSFPKERVEVFGGGRVGVIEDFKQWTTVVGGKTESSKSGQDKGHAAELQRFVQAIREGTPAPISWPELRAVSRASILALQSLRSGRPLAIEGEVDR